MDYLAICTKKECRLTFAFRPMATPIRPLAAGEAFCPVCGSPAILGAGSHAGLFRVYHQAFPSALGKKEKKKILREILDVARLIIDANGELSEEEALQAAEVSPETRGLFFAVSGWAFGAIGAICAVIALLITQADREEDRQFRADLMQALTELMKTQAAGHQQSDSTLLSTRSRAESPEADQGRSGASPKQKGRTGKPAKRGKKPSDVPLG